MQKFQYRIRRGLINGLGTAIKFITGNPDNDDIIKINENLQSLYSSQNEIIKQINSHTSFANQITSRYSKDLKTIHANLNSSFIAINNVSNTLDTELVVQYYNLVSFRLINILQTIERTISLAFSEMTNLEIIRHEELLEIINHLKLVYKRSELIELDYIHIFKILEFSKFRIVSAKHTITCILYIPILDESLFRYAKIYPIPDLQNKVMLPPYKYHLQGATKEFWTDEKCKMLESQTVCIEKPRVHKCEIIDARNCTFAIVSNDYKLYAQLNNGKIIVSSKSGSRVIEQCSDEINSVEIANSALISSKINCKVTIGETTFENSFSNFTFKDSFKIANYRAGLSVNLQLKHMDDLINLKEETKILEQKFYIHPVLHITHILITLIIICISLIGIVLFIFKHKVKLLINKGRSKMEEVELQEVQEFHQHQKNEDILS